MTAVGGRPGRNSEKRKDDGSSERSIGALGLNTQALCRTVLGQPVGGAGPAVC